MLNHRSFVRILCSGVFLAFAAGGSAQAQAWLTVDVPGATAVSPTAETANNTIVGYYTNPDSTFGSFVRTSDGTLSTFNLSNGGSTQVLSADKYDDVAGTVSNDGVSQGFMQTGDGQATLFSVKKSSITEATAINDPGSIAGDYIDPATSVQMAYIRKPNGSVKTFGAPDGSNITIKAMNNAETVVGSYGTHGYMRDAQGTMTTFRFTATFIAPTAINNGGAITGYYEDSSGKIHGFVRSSSGNVSGFNAPNSANGTFPTGINDNGIVVGWTKDANNIPHGFALNTNGSHFASLNAPNGVNGTELLAIGKDGKMVGFYYDADGAAHGLRVNAAQTGF